MHGQQSIKINLVVSCSFWHVFPNTTKWNNY